jgi:hypothetical protein
MKRLLPLLALAAPLAAQSFGDGPAYGGSRAFSEGLSPKGNPARFDQAQPGWYLGWEMGDEKPKGFKGASDQLLGGFGTGNSTAVQTALEGFQKTPYAERRRTYGFAIAAQGGIYLAMGRELLTATRVRPDLDPTHLGAGLGGNLSTAETGRALIDRMVVGAGSAVEGQAYGFAFRVERIRSASQTTLLNGPTSADATLDFGDVQRSNLTATLDAGSQFDLAQGFRLAVLGDRLIPRTINGVREKAQFHAGLSLDLGPASTLVVEADLNQAQRLPLPVDQRTAGASLRMAFNPALIIRVGAQRRTVDGQAATLVGASLTYRNAPLNVTFGFQFGDDRAQKAVAAKVDG